MRNLLASKSTHHWQEEVVAFYPYQAEFPDTLFQQYAVENAATGVRYGLQEENFYPFESPFN